MRKSMPIIALLILAGCQSCPVTQGNVGDVKAAFNAWIDDVNHKDKQALLALYDPRADLHPTLSGKLRTSPGEVGDYFDHFLSLPKLHAEAGASHIQVFDDTAVNDGFYTFFFEKKGKSQTLRARYSFTYLKEADGWKIIDHHSSVMPQE